VKRDVHSQSQKCQKCRNLICNCLLTWLWQLEAQPNNFLYKFWRVEIMGYCLKCSQIKRGVLGISFDQDRMLVTISIISCNCVVKVGGDVNLWYISALAVKTPRVSSILLLYALYYFWNLEFSLSLQSNDLEFNVLELPWTVMLTS